MSIERKILLFRFNQFTSKYIHLSHKMCFTNLNILFVIVPAVESFLVICMQHKNHSADSESFPGSCNLQDKLDSCEVMQCRLFKEIDKRESGFILQLRLSSPFLIK